MNPFRSLREYESFVYTLSDRHPVIARSTLTILRRGFHHAELSGDVILRNCRRLVIYERLVWEDKGTIRIIGYSYEAWKENALIHWYDSQPHPNDSTLASTHPHHQHIHPDIRRHRIPAPRLSFHHPNLPFLLAETEGDLS